MSLYKAFNASFDRGEIPQRPRESYKTLAAEAAEFSNAKKIESILHRISRVEVMVERLAQNPEKALTMPQNRLKMPLEATFTTKQVANTKKGTKK